eukprot:TRINITY_DN5282_c0_g1_i6.p1 TRINITY_DN5282_c0_g1~~TRINITY_DN5282_c0_g1_i6.p1  ORF type:complete len:295 (-),score=21.99 TRINITY_DN5282_c0_g1_i6:54-938(-)
MGMASALETLCGQAFGAKQYRLLGFLLHRAIFALLCTSLPLSMLWIFMENILVGLGQDPSIAHEAGKYARWMTPALFAFAFLQPLIKFLQAQSLVIPMMFSSVITLALHAPLCWVLVFKVGLGNRGAALANAISYWFNVILLLLYVRFATACNKTWAPISGDSLRGLMGFLKLAIPSAAMICLEYWSFEMLILLSGILPNPELETSVLSICLSTISLAYMIPFGLGAAARLVLLPKYYLRRTFNKEERATFPNRESENSGIINFSCIICQDNRLLPQTIFYVIEYNILSAQIML